MEEKKNTICTIPLCRWPRFFVDPVIGLELVHDRKIRKDREIGSGVNFIEPAIKQE